MTPQTDPHGTLTTYSYDDQGNRISTSDPRGYTTNFTYDQAGHLIERHAEETKADDEDRQRIRQKNQCTEP